MGANTISVASTPAAGAAAASPRARILDFAQARPTTAFAVFTVAHTLAWTLVLTVAAKSLPLDMIEGVAYGRDWQIGYWKHPPLPWLLLDGVHRLFGGQIWAFYLLCQLQVAAAFWAIWRLGREILSPAAALAAVVLLDADIVFNLKSAPFNHNTAQLALFSLAGLSLFLAFKRGLLRDWLCVGLWFALAFYAKYEAVVLAAPAVLFAVADPVARRCWRTPGPYIASAVFLLLLAPELAWLTLSVKFAPLIYAGDKAPTAATLSGLLATSANFVLTAALYILPVLGLFLTLALRSWATPPAPTDPSDAFARRYLAALAFGPLAVSVAAGLLTHREMGGAWVMQFWCFISLFLMAMWRPTVDRPAVRRLAVGWAGLTVLFVVIKLVGEVFLIAPGKLIETQFSGEEFSAAVTRAWRREEPGRPLPYLIGEFWTAGNVMLFSPEHPRLLESGDPVHSPRIDLTDVRRRGAVILFAPVVRLNAAPIAKTGAPWLAAYPTAEARKPFIIRRRTVRGDVEWAVGWAILKPQDPPLVVR